MSWLTAILTHLEPSLVARQLKYLRAVAPGARFVVCYGGPAPSFEQLQAEDSLFIDEASLRERPDDRTHLGVFRAVWEQRVRAQSEIEHVYFIEFDHLILQSDFERRLAAVSERTSAGLLAKLASPRTNTNWVHYLRYRDDHRFNSFVTGISTRDDSESRWGCLGTGMLFRRDALEALCSIEDPPQVYVELFVPTVLHHLGFDVVDVDAHCDLYTKVSWRPEYGLAEAIAAKREGRTFIHPFKHLDALDAVRAG